MANRSTIVISNETTSLNALALCGCVPTCFLGANATATCSTTAGNALALCGCTPACFLGSNATANNSTCLNGQLASFYQAASTAINTSNIASQSVVCATGATTAGNSTCLNGQLASFYQASSTAINTGNIASQTVATAGNSTCLGGIDSSRYLFGCSGIGFQNWSGCDTNAITKAGFYALYNSTNAPTLGDGGLINIPAWMANDGTSRYNFQLASHLSDCLYYRITNASGVGTWTSVITSSNIGNQTVNNSGCLGGQIASFYQPASTAINTSNIASQSVAGANVAYCLSGCYIGGGTENPTYFCNGMVKAQMLTTPSWGWADTLWIGTYYGGDVPEVNQLVFSKSQDRGGWRRQNYGSSTWGTIHEFITSTNIGSQIVNCVSTPSGTYKHLGAWGVARLGAGAILVNTAFCADNAQSLNGYNSSTCVHSPVVRASTCMYSPDFQIESDVTCKTNIKSLEFNSVDIEYKEFNFISNPERKRYGVIAQELQKVQPEMVNENEEGILSVSYIDLLIKEVSYLKQRVCELERRLM